MHDYRRLKKVLNSYHKFSFSMPRKGKDFTPQQKSAITRLYNKYGEFIKLNRLEKNSFITSKKKKLISNVEGIRTNKGIFYKYPGAELTKAKVDGKTINTVVIKYRKVKEMFIPFPKEIMSNVDLIKPYVDKISKSYKSDFIMWSVYGNRSQAYDIDSFSFYILELFSNPNFIDDLENKTFFNGVYLGWEPKND